MPYMCPTSGDPFGHREDGLECTAQCSVEHYTEEEMLANGVFTCLKCEWPYYGDYGYSNWPDRCSSCLRELNRARLRKRYKELIKEKWNGDWRNNPLKFITLTWPTRNVPIPEGNWLGYWLGLNHKGEEIEKPIYDDDYAYRVCMPEIKRAKEEITKVFYNLRRTSFWKNHVRGWIWAYEAPIHYPGQVMKDKRTGEAYRTVGEHNFEIHPHLHLIADADYMEHEEFYELVQRYGLWKNVRALKPSKEAISYVRKEYGLRDYDEVANVVGYMVKYVSKATIGIRAHGVGGTFIRRKSDS